MKFSRLLFVFSFLFSVSLFAESPSFKFTGYKFTEKVGVSGTFDKIKWTFDKNKESIEELLRSARLEIDTYSLNSGDMIRNKNIVSALFKNWGGQKIFAEVSDVDSNKKQVSINMKVGDSVKKVQMNYAVEKGVLSLTGSIDLLELGFKNAFTALAEKCRALHTGADGVSKTWSIVDLKISGKL